MRPIENVINPASGSNRIAKCGKITSYPFSLGNNRPFTVFIKSDNSEVTTITAKLFQDNKAGEVPVITNDWTPLLINTLDSVALSDVTVYWGATII